MLRFPWQAVRWAHGRLLAFSLFGWLFFGMTASHAARPNIVLIVSDDMGYSDLGCYGGEIKTPHLDGLAERGIRFTNYYVNNMCWPTRASLMTGLYPKSALTVDDQGERGLRRDVRSLPEVLQESGYATFMTGKWHLSSFKDDDGPNTPHHRGFDQFYGTLEGASDFFAPYGLQLNGDRRHEEWEDNPDYYYTDAITDYALKFVQEHQQDGNSDQPFFLYVAYNAAHWPLHAKPNDIAQYRGRYASGWDQLREERFSRMKQLGVIDPSWELSSRHPAVPAWSDEPNKEWQARRMEVYAAQISSMDENIGRLLAHLQETGLTENTLVLFQHDNGGCHVEYTPTRTGSWTRPKTTDGRNLDIRPGNVPGLMPGSQATFQSYGYGWANASNTPFRFYKQHDHEGGVRSPLIVCWPERIASRLEGTLVEEVCHAIDLMPTLLAAVGLPNWQQRTVPFEGRSFLPTILDGLELAFRSNPIFWAHSRGRAVRLGDWKLVARDKKGEWELYDLGRDPTERANLAPEFPERVKLMAGWHKAWQERQQAWRVPVARPGQ